MVEVLTGAGLGELKDHLIGRQSRDAEIIPANGTTAIESSKFKETSIIGL
jgi:hypothetical protein